MRVDNTERQDLISGKVGGGGSEAPDLEEASSVSWPTVECAPRGAVDARRRIAVQAGEPGHLPGYPGGSQTGSKIGLDR